MILTKYTSVSDENLIVSEDQESKPTSKGPLTGVKCKQKNAHTQFSSLQERSFQSFPSLVNSFLRKNPALLLVPGITLRSFPDFLNISESCQEKCVFVQRYNASLYPKLRQTAEPCVTNLWFWKDLGQSQSWLGKMQTNLWKLYMNSRIS